MVASELEYVRERNKGREKEREREREREREGQKTTLNFSLSHDSCCQICRGFKSLDVGCELSYLFKYCKAKHCF